MDWIAAVERNHEALKRILASLVAMAGLPGAAALTSPLWGGRREAWGGACNFTTTPARRSDCRPTLPRHLHRAVLRLLRPAEAAVRRLVIVAARDVVLPALAPPRPRKPKPKPAILRNGIGTGIVLPSHLPHPEMRGGAEPRRTIPARTLSLPLVDPLPRRRRGRRAARGTPRISFPGFSAPSAVAIRRPPSPDDLIDAGRLGHRLQALAYALDDLPKHALRFARWRARRDAARSSPVHGGGGPAKQVEGARNRHTRIWPLRPGRPPGKRPAGSRRPVHEVDEVLGDLQFFAFTALQQPDTS